MDVTIMHDRNMPEHTSQLVERIQSDYPGIDFIEASRFSWHAGKQHISYTKASLRDTKGLWALLHELGHAQLKHAKYKSDIELLHMEVAAWTRAKELAAHYAVNIDEEYVQDSLDSYRDWLHIRSTCPKCYEHCLQTDIHTYRCQNCNSTWQVTQSRLCRPYRRTYKKNPA